MQFYSPGLFWLLNLPPRVCGEILANLYRNPKNPHVHTLLRIGILLGKDFSNWLFDKWQRKWHNNPQPPTFFWTFKRMINRMDVNNKIPIALRLSPTAPLSIRSVEPSITVNDLLKTPTNAANLLSQTCILVFEGKKDQRSVARQLDYIAYGDEIEKRAVEIAQAVLDLVGSEEAGELIDD